MTEDELAALVRRAAAGDRAASDVLVRRVEPDVRAEVHRRLGSDVRAREDTDDILQQTLFEAVSRLSTFEYRGEAALRAWLATIAENRVRGAGRFHRQDKRNPGREEGPVATAGPSAALTSPSLAASRSEGTARLVAAVATLPPDERRVVELHSFQGMGFREVAEACGLADKDAARYLFQKALKRMGEVMEEGA